MVGAVHASSAVAAAQKLFEMLCERRPSQMQFASQLERRLCTKVGAQCGRGTNAHLGTASQSRRRARTDSRWAFRTASFSAKPHFEACLCATSVQSGEVTLDERRRPTRSA